MPPIFPGSSNAGGQCMGFPDVCFTPAPPLPDIPIPYPNFGMVNQAENTSMKVLFMNKEAVTLKSKIKKSMGDEAGVGASKGMISGMNMKEVTFKKGSSKVKIEGQPCIYQTSTSAHNGTNANWPMGLQMAPSQQKVIVSP